MPKDDTSALRQEFLIPQGLLDRWQDFALKRQVQAIHANPKYLQAVWFPFLPFFLLRLDFSGNEPA